MEEKWKLSKKEGSSSSSFTRSFSTKSSSTTSSKAPQPPLKRSSSLKIFGSSPSSPKRPLPRSSSPKDSPPKISRSFSQKARKCSSMAKERKARFYIMRRCVAMLVCWHENGD